MPIKLILQGLTVGYLTLLASVPVSAATCNPGDCLNGGVCNTVTASPLCFCPLPYIGSNCVFPANYCSILQPEKNITSFPVCLNNCSCTMGYADPYFSCTDPAPLPAGSCNCFTRWSGVRCSLTEIVRFNGNDTQTFPSLSECTSSCQPDMRLLALLLLIMPITVLIGLLIKYKCIHQRPNSVQNPKITEAGRRACDHRCKCPTKDCPCYKYQCKLDARCKKCQEDACFCQAINGHLGPLLGALMCASCPIEMYNILEHYINPGLNTAANMRSCGCDCKNTSCPCLQGHHDELQKCACQQRMNADRVEYDNLAASSSAVHEVEKPEADAKNVCGCNCRSIDCPCARNEGDNHLNAGCLCQEECEISSAPETAARYKEFTKEEVAFKPHPAAESERI